MKCVILTGGSGSRLMPLTESIRKAYLPLGGKRVFDHILDRLPGGLNVEISDDDAGAIAAVSHAIKDNQPMLIVCGDNYFSESLDTFVSAYAGYTLVGIYDVKSRKKAANFGLVDLHRDGRQIRKITEKPAYPLTTLVSTGLYIFPPEVFSYIQNLAAARPRGNLGDLIKYILGFEPVYGFLIKGKWIDIGTTESYQEALKIINE